MRRRMMLLGGLTVTAVAAGAGWLGWRRRSQPPVGRPPVDSDAYLSALPPLTPPTGPLRVYHLGHSLVGRDMPAMLAQLAGHSHASQLGWGTPLRTHWEDDLPIGGFEAENAHPAHRPAKPALASGAYDAVVLTEMVELRDAIRWHASPEYLARWAIAAQAGNPDARLYLYETWHSLHTPDGWLARIDGDLAALWQGQLLQGAMAWGAPALHIIPGGQVLGAAARAAEAGEIPGVTSRAELFTTTAEGKPDDIHPSDLGNYLIALAHYAVLYHRSPLGLPHQVTRADGQPVTIAPETAAALQDLAWQVARGIPQTGIAP